MLIITKRKHTLVYCYGRKLWSGLVEEWAVVL